MTICICNANSTNIHTCTGAGGKTIDVRAINDRRSWQELSRPALSKDVAAAGDNVNEFNLHAIHKCRNATTERKLTQGTRYKIQDANSFSARSASRTELRNVIDMQPPPSICSLFSPQYVPTVHLLCCLPYAGRGYISFGQQRKSLTPYSRHILDLKMGIKPVHLDDVNISCLFLH